MTNNKPKVPKEIQEDDLVIFEIDDRNSKGLSHSTNQNSNMLNLIEALQTADPNSLDAEANKTSISDNNGGRIELEEDLSSTNVIKR